MRRADRLFRIVQILRNRRFVTAEQLSEMLEVSQRTIYRDVRDIIAGGVPVKGEAGVGYQMERSAVLPPLTFNSEEIEALVLGARMAVAWADPALAAAARSVLDKVEAMVPEPLRDVLLRTALFAPGGEWTRSRTMGLDVLRGAISGRNRLAFDYVRGDGVSSRRVVRPLGLYFWGAKWNLAAWCELRRAFRSFRPDRMSGLAVLDEVFEEVEGVSLEAFLKEREEDDAEHGVQAAVPHGG
ncbi:MAG: YafY family transcriptional regulator [Myxococcales bacterium]|nr:YafY family transcriptional regulator [Myxococcales bacterium]MCB9552098.1 YafY family transcriptional regulator [Myxococcales bacterium]